MAHLLLLLAEQPRHGYELAESLRMSEFEGITTSTVYRELAKLEEDGLVQSFWEASQTRGPARRVYELTTKGRKALGACAVAADDLSGTLAEYVERCQAQSRTPRRPIRRSRGPVVRRPPA